MKSFGGVFPLLLLLGASLVSCAKAKSNRPGQNGCCSHIKFETLLPSKIVAEFEDIRGLHRIHLQQEVQNDSEDIEETTLRIHLRQTHIQKGVQTPEWAWADSLPCPSLDAIAEFDTSAFRIFDLDEDGIGEVVVSYRLGCMGGMEPIPTYLVSWQGNEVVSWQGNEVVSIRGESVVRIPGETPYGGEFQLSENLARNPALAEFLVPIWKLAAGHFPKTSPDLWVERLFREYQAGKTGEAPNFLGSRADTLFTPELVQLIRKDQKESAGEVGLIDGDLICDCQDYEISETKARVSAKTDTTASVQIEFMNFGKSRTVQFEMRAKDGRWRIADIRTPSRPSLVRALMGISNK